MRAVVLIVAVGIVIGMAVVVAHSAADQLRRTATDSALGEVEVILQGYVDPVLQPGSILTHTADAAVAAAVQQLGASGDIRAVHIWARDGTAVYSNLPGVRGLRFTLPGAVARAFEGHPSAEYKANADTRLGAGLGANLDIALPIRDAGSAQPYAVYQVIEDAASIETRVAATERDVFVIALAAASGLLVLILLAFLGTSRRLSVQNRLMREQATTRELLSADLRRSEERFRSLVRNASDVILVIGPDGGLLYESPAVKTVLGYEPGARVGENAIEGLHPDDQPRVARLLREMAGVPGSELTLELRGRHVDGSWRYLEGTAKNLLDDPAVRGFVINYRDITERRRLEDELRHQAFHDVLTGLANRALLMDRLEHALGAARRHGRGLAVLFIDLDDFKAINDSLGHMVGDQLLAAAAQRILACLRAGDTPARIGGDEFAVLLEDVEAEMAAEVGGRIVEALRRPFRAAERELHAHASVGIALHTDPSQTADDLLRDADVAMYVAKRRGKDRVETFHSDAHRPTVNRLALLADLREAFDAGQLALVFQPVVELTTRRVTALEALLRWHHPERGIVQPDEFVSLAEESGHISVVGSWVLREACRQLRVWDKVVKGPPLSVGVNVSGRQVEPSLVGVVQDALRAARLSPHRLILEITESALLEDPDGARAILEQLRATGVRIAIDDFGTGRSSLDYLRRLPVDVLKIDRTFVAALGDGHQGPELLGSILSLGRALHIDVVAEGVEDEGQARELQLLGARYGQGFHFSRPLSPPEMTGFLRRYPVGLPARYALDALPAEVPGSR